MCVAYAAICLRAWAGRAIQRAHQLVAAAASSATAGIAEAVKVNAAGGIRGVGPLHKGQQTLDCLQVLARGLVVHDVRRSIHDM